MFAYGSLMWRPGFEHDQALDAWLHGYGDPTGPDAPRIKAQIRKQFYPDTDDWREAIIWRSRQVVRQALAGLGQANR